MLHLVYLRADLAKHILRHAEMRLIHKGWDGRLLDLERGLQLLVKCLVPPRIILKLLLWVDIGLNSLLGVSKCYRLRGSWFVGVEHRHPSWVMFEGVIVSLIHSLNFI